MRNYFHCYSSKKVENNTKSVTQRKPSSTTSTDEKKEVEKKVVPKIEKYNPEKKVTVRSIASSCGNYLMPY